MGVNTRMVNAGGDGEGDLGEDVAGQTGSVGGEAKSGAGAAAAGTAGLLAEGFWGS